MNIKKKDKRDKSKKEYPGMPYLETEEEASERIADFYDSRDDTRKKEEKHIDTPYLKSKKKVIGKNK